MILYVYKLTGYLSDSEIKQFLLDNSYYEEINGCSFISNRGKLVFLEKELGNIAFHFENYKPVIFQYISKIEVIRSRFSSLGMEDFFHRWDIDKRISFNYGASMLKELQKLGYDYNYDLLEE